MRPIFVQITGAGPKASGVWNGFIDRWHDLGYTPLVGAQMRTIVEDSEVRLLAAPVSPLLGKPQPATPSSTVTAAVIDNSTSCLGSANLASFRRSDFKRQSYLEISPPLDWAA